MFRDVGWAHYALALSVSLLLFVLQCGSSDRNSPENLYGSIQGRFVAGELDQAAAEAQRVSSLSIAKGSDWAAKFRLQRAWIETYRGNSPAVLALLEPELPEGDSAQSLGSTRGSLLALAYSRTGKLSRAEAMIAALEARCPDDLCRSQVHWADGLIAIQKGDFDKAERTFELSLAGSRASGNTFLQVQTLLNLGVIVLRQNHYEDALERFREASAIASTIGARQAMEIAEGNAGSTLYLMGNYPQALANAKAAEELARTLGSPIDQVAWLKDEGRSQYKMEDFKAARLSFQKSYQLARSIQNDEGMVDDLFALASLSLQDGDLQSSLAQAREAERAAERVGDRAALLEPALVEAQAMARLGDRPGAQEKLLALLHAPVGSSSQPFDRWQIESVLARLTEDAGDQAGAASWFQRAIGTFRLQRDTLSEIDDQLPYSENGTSLYLDYMEELLREGKPMDALLVLDLSRAEALSEKPATGTVQRSGATDEWKKDPGAIARRLGGTVLVYCLRPQTSYLWAITPRGPTLFRLPGKEILLPLLGSHARSILAARDVLSEENSAGLALYHDLVEPAANLIPSGGKVFVIADGELSHLNFETLLAPSPKPHFWIEDVDVVNARSLSLLAARSTAVRKEGAPSKLLLVGSPIYTRSEYGELPHSAEEVAGVAGHFSPDRRALLTGSQATRGGYLGSRPGEYRYIHFVAHATASEINPLDSAVILSAQPGEPDIYKLYARDILNSKIQADLVTISACYGSGVRTYSGEGLVGLAWAFLRAGSHNVVGALWEVSDASTPRLMNDLYDHLAEGESPDTALRSAKLAMMQRGGAFHKPFYWAAFQLYAGA